MNYSDDELINIDVHNSQNKVLTLDGLIVLATTDNYISRNGKQYIDFMKTNNKLEKYYNHLLSNINKTILDINDAQYGGGAGLVFGILGGVGLSAVIAYLIYKWITRPKCKLSYPILQPDDVPSKLELFSKIVPNSWIEDDDIVIAKKGIISKIQSILDHFEFINTDGKSMAKTALKSVARVTASVALDVATFGAGGDVIISLLYTIKSMLDLMMSLINSVVQSFEDENTTRFIYDVLNVDFTEGPFGVKCWIEYILSKYGENTKVFSIMCGFFDKILNKVASFIGNALGTMIPNSAGLPALLIPILIKLFKKKTLNKLESQMNKYFEKIPHDIKIIIKNPQLLSEYLQPKISSAKLFLFGKGEGLFEALNDNIEGFAFGIHRFFALSFSLLQLFKMCEKYANKKKKKNEVRSHIFEGTKEDKIREFRSRYRQFHHTT
jgi:hypothetical protein